MLKEERELRKFYSVAYPSEADEIKRYFKKLLTALVRAVRADEREKCAKVADGYSYTEPVAAKISAAIREGGVTSSRTWPRSLRGPAR